MKTTPQSPIVLSTACIVDGRYIPAGDPVPFASEADLPENLKGLVADGSEDFFDHRDRNYYFGSGSRGQARRILGNIQWQDDLVDSALEERKLPPETEEALRESAERSSALGKAQLQSNQDAIDTLHESLARVAEPQPLFVKRGGMWAKTQNARLKPAEHVFARRLNGEYESIGIVDANGEPPPPEIHI